MAFCLTTSKFNENYSQWFVLSDLTNKTSSNFQLQQTEVKDKNTTVNQKVKTKLQLLSAKFQSLFPEDCELTQRFEDYQHEIEHWPLTATLKTKATLLSEHLNTLNRLHLLISSPEFSTLQRTIKRQGMLQTLPVYSTKNSSNLSFSPQLTLDNFEFTAQFFEAKILVQTTLTEHHATYQRTNWKHCKCEDCNQSINPCSFTQNNLLEYSIQELAATINRRDILLQLRIINEFAERAIHLKNETIYDVKELEDSEWFQRGDRVMQQVIKRLNEKLQDEFPFNPILQKRLNLFISKIFCSPKFISVKACEVIYKKIMPAFYTFLSILNGRIQTSKTFNRLCLIQIIPEDVTDIERVARELAYCSELLKLNKTELTFQIHDETVYPTSSASSLAKLLKKETLLQLLTSKNTLVEQNKHQAQTAHSTADKKPLPPTSPYPSYSSRKSWCSCIIF